METKSRTARIQRPSFSVNAASTMTGAASAAFSQTVGEPGRLLRHLPVPEKPVEPTEPRSRADRFITDMIRLLPKLTEEIHLQRVGWSEIRMAPFGGVFPIALPRPRSERPPRGRCPGRSPRWRRRQPVHRDSACGVPPAEGEARRAPSPQDRSGGGRIGSRRSAGSIPHPRSRGGL